MGAATYSTCCALDRGEGHWWIRTTYRVLYVCRQILRHGWGKEERSRVKKALSKFHCFFGSQWNFCMPFLSVGVVGTFIRTTVLHVICSSSQLRKKAVLESERFIQLPLNRKIGIAESLYWQFIQLCVSWANEVIRLFLTITQRIRFMTREIWALQFHFVCTYRAHSALLCWAVSAYTRVDRQTRVMNSEQGHEGGRIKGDQCLHESSCSHPLIEYWIPRNGRQRIDHGKSGI